MRRGSLKLNNTTNFPNHLVRRVLSFCCKQLEMPLRHIKEVTVRNRRDGSLSGHAHPMHGVLVLSVSDKGSPDWRLHQLVIVAAHEIAHVFLAQIVQTKSRKSRRYGTVSRGGSEKQTEWHEKLVYNAFLAKEAELMAAWNKEPSRKKKTPKSLVEVRAEKARKMLHKWQRKLKAAENKVKKYKKQVAYYDKKLAEQPATNGDSL